jgi:hypothetical protein
MKTFFATVFFALIGLNALCQQSGSGEFILVVKGNGGQSGHTMHVFKPERRIKLETTAREFILSSSYVIHSDHILLDNYKVVYYDDIASIRGRVMDNWGVGPGLLMFSIGTGLLFPMAFLGAWSDFAFMLIYATPPVAILSTGIFLMSHRKFRMNKGWEVLAIPAGN